DKKKSVFIRVDLWFMVHNQGSMKRRSLALLALALLLAACNYPGAAPASATPDFVATAVAGTLAAGDGAPAPQPSDTPQPGLLPQALLYLSDRSGSAQVWRLA